MYYYECKQTKTRGIAYILVDKLEDNLIPSYNQHLKYKVVNPTMSSLLLT